MTIIVALGNNDQVIQISDRRLSSNGRLIEDESNKCGALYCSNARMAFGYTGLAKWADFNTFNWLLKALHDSAVEDPSRSISSEPDYTILGILQRLKYYATQEFINNPSLKVVPREHLRLAVMFSGYIKTNAEFKIGNAILSNFHNFERNTSYPTAQYEFDLYLLAANDNAKWPVLVQRVGNWEAMSDSDIDDFRAFLIQKKSAKAIVSKAVNIVRLMSESTVSQETIGKQLTSMIVPRDPNVPVDFDYHSEYPKRDVFGPAIVQVLPGCHMAVNNIRFQFNSPASVSAVGRNKLCPCGSGKRYKHCHGQKIKDKQSVGLMFFPDGNNK